MEYGYYIHIFIGLYKSIQELEKHDFSTDAVLSLEKKLDESIDLFFYMIDRLLK